MSPPRSKALSPAHPSPSSAARERQSIPVVGGSVLMKIFKDRGEARRTPTAPTSWTSSTPLKTSVFPQDSEKPIEITWNIPRTSSPALQARHVLRCREKVQPPRPALHRRRRRRHRALQGNGRAEGLGRLQEGLVNGQSKGTTTSPPFPPRADAATPVHVGATLTVLGTGSLSPSPWPGRFYAKHKPRTTRQELCSKTAPWTTAPSLQVVEKKVSFIVDDAPVPHLPPWRSRPLRRSASSIIDMRLVHTSHDHLRIDYHAHKLPLTKGERSNRFFSCLHNTVRALQLRRINLSSSLLDENDPVSHHNLSPARRRDHAMMGEISQTCTPRSVRRFSFRRQAL